MAQPTITLRQDGNNYVEGMSIGKYILVNVLMDSFLQPSVTYTEHLMADQGMIAVPKISGTKGVTTALCEDGSPGETSTEMVNLNIDRKATELFDGCFTTAGIADKNWEAALNTYKMYNLREQYETDIIEYITGPNETNDDYANITAAVADPATFAGNPSGYLNALRKEYTKNTRGIRSTVGLCSVDFYYSVVDAGINLGTPLGDEFFVRGTEAVGRTSGLLLVPSILMDEAGVDVVVYNPMGLHIGIPTTTKAIGQNILGAGGFIPDSMSFSDGLLSMWETQAKKGIVATYVHKPFGRLIPEKAWVLGNKFVPVV